MTETKSSSRTIPLYPTDKRPGANLFWLKCEYLGSNVVACIIRYWPDWIIPLTANDKVDIKLVRLASDQGEIPINSLIIVQSGDVFGFPGYFQQQPPAI
jgi:hypothetical protein